MREIAIQTSLIAATLALAALLLAVIRRKLTPRSPAIAALAAVPVSIFFGLVAVSYAGVYPTANAAVVLLASFIGMQSIHAHPWTVRSIFRSLALVSGLVTLWAAYENNILASVLSLGVTGTFVYLSMSGRGSPAAGADAS